MSGETTPSEAPSPAKLSMASDRAEGDEQETLPLYEAFDHGDSLENASLVLPDVKAHPDEVRDYLTHLLEATRGLHPDHVRRVVSRWTSGTGQELRSYPATMYLDLFGREDGWMVYKEVRLAILKADPEKNWAFSSKGTASY